MKKSIVIVNPSRYTGYSYIYYIVNFLKDYELVAIWTNETQKIQYDSVLGHLVKYTFFFNEMSFDQLVEKLKQHNPKCFLTGDDVGFFLADKLQHYFFPEHSNDPTLADIRLDKSKYLEFLSHKGLSLTKQFKININQLPDINSKFILKPVNGAGNENVSIVNSMNDIELLIKDSNQKYLIQEYVEGLEYCMEICSCFGIHRCIMASIYKGEYFVDGKIPWREENELVDPSDPNIPVVFDYVKSILTALGIKLGLTWTQVKIKNGIPQLIEINFRSQGHGLIQCIHSATGCNYASESLKSYLKLDTLDLKKTMYEKRGDFNKICVNNRRKRYLSGIDWSCIENLPSTKHRSQYVKLPNEVDLSTSFRTTLGVILLQSNNHEQYINDYNSIKKWKELVEY